MDPEIRYCTTKDGVDIAYTDTGEGPPFVITSGVLWSHVGYTSAVTEVFAAGGSIAGHHRVIRYDARGTGMSDRRTLDFSLETRVADLECVVDHLGLERFALFAYMHGTFTAVRYAPRHPARLTQLILFNPIAHGADWRHRVRRHDSARELAEEEWEEYTLMIANANFGYRDSEKALALAERLRASMTPQAVQAFYASQGDIDIGDILASVSVPTLVISNDAMAMPVEWHREVAAKIPGAKLIRTSGKPDAWWGDQETRALADFLGDPTPVAPSGRTVLPSGTAVILFADIVDSTALTERLGDTAFRAKARELDGRLRTVIRDHSGTPIEGKLLGDGVLGVFTSARQAIEAALACGRAGDDGDLPLHLGLHAGDVIREDNNVYGGAVNIASRISGLSVPGEVLVSDTVRSLARTSAGVTFEDRGEQALKGVGEPVRVWAVREGE